MMRAETASPVRHSSWLYSEILHGATGSLPGRLPDVLYWVVHPFLGDERAEAEREKTRAATAAE